MRLKDEYQDLLSAVNDALLPFGFTHLRKVKTKIWEKKLNLQPNLQTTDQKVLAQNFW